MQPPEIEKWINFYSGYGLSNNNISLKKLIVLLLFCLYLPVMLSDG